MSAKTEVRLGVIGLGNMGSEHIRNIEAGKVARLRVTAVCDIDYEKAKRHCEKFGLKCRIYQDYKEMLDKEQPDVAHVLTPHYLHCEMIVEILGRNINCLCEKPLYIKENEYDLIKGAVEKSNATLGICFQHRYLKVNQYIKNEVKNFEINVQIICFDSLILMPSQEFVSKFL